MSHMDRIAQDRANGTEPDRDIDIAAIRDRSAKAAPGPWYWSGSVDTEMYLAYWHPGIGRSTVMAFARHGMQGAQPMFIEHTPRNMPGLLFKGTEVPIFEVCPEATDRKDERVYRGNIVGFRNGNAEFIAHARQDIDDLLTRIDELEQRVVDTAGSVTWGS